jgi:predicted outer membrane repeat protein
MAEVLLSHVSFVNNSAGIGSAVAITESSNVAIESCEFDSNRARNIGGAVSFLTKNVNVSIDNCTFVSNQAGVSGGALYIGDMNEVFVVQDTLFRGNYAGEEGGEATLQCREYSRRC